MMETSGTILIVEDDVVLGGVLQAAFRREWTVELATSAQAALAAFRQAPPDIVLTDKNMPGMDGVELLRQLRRLDPAVGVVVMTAYGTVDSARDSIDWGVDAYIEKPFPDVFELMREMARLRERVIARRRQARASAVPLLVVAACSDVARRARLKEALAGVDRLGWCDTVEDLASAVRAHQCTVTLLDCVSLAIDAAEMVPLIDAQRVPCLVVAEGLSVFEITRLIDLGVKALIDRPVEDSRFAEQLKRALERLRGGTS